MYMTKKKNSPATPAMPKTHRIKTQLTAPYADKHYEKNNQPSMTVPGQGMSVAEAVRRYRKGLPVTGSADTPHYREGDVPLQDLSQMDIVDRQEYIDSVADALVTIRQRIDLAAKTEQEKKIIDKANEMFLAKMDELRNLGTPASGDNSKSVTNDNTKPKS